MTATALVNTMHISDPSTGAPVVQLPFDGPRDVDAGAEAGAATIEQYAELGPLHRGRALCGDPLAIDAMRYEPRGVVAALVPFNDPVAIAAQGLAAALATGNTMTGRVLVEHPSVDVVVHTGSADAGRAIAIACARRGAQAVLELGGNDPLVVDADVDPVWAARQAASGAFANAGQVCVSVERVYVHAAIAESFTESLVAEALSLRTGPATDPRTTLGPLVDARARAGVHVIAEASLEQGATARCGGVLPDGPGCFYPATVLTDVTETMPAMAHETFGPIAPVAVVGSFGEGLARANASDYGLAATVLTASQEHAARACAELRAGTVRVNAVWGGAPGGAAHPRGISGSALGYGPELLDELTQLKMVHMEPAPRPGEDLARMDGVPLGDSVSS